MIEKQVLMDVLQAAVSTGGDFAEVFVEDTIGNSISMIGGKIESVQSGRDYGVGIRVFSGNNCVYVFANKDDRDSLIETAFKAAQAVKGIREGKVSDLTLRDYGNLHPVLRYPDLVPKEQKVQAMRAAYEAAFSFSDMITQVSVRYLDKDQSVLIANTEGLLTEDRRVNTRIAISAVAEKGKEMQTGMVSPGAMRGFEFIERLDIEGNARKAAEMAVTMANASYCEARVMPVVIENGFGGVIFHEACGHSLEATSVAKGTSVFAGRMGDQIASGILTAVDDGTLSNEWGSLNIDDEGTPTRRKVLIENGVLKSYMVDKLNGRRMGAESTGSGRRQSYRYAPTSRMTNTFIANGKDSREDIISATDFGLYAKTMGGGSVNPGTGEFNFAVLEGYMIRNGKIAEPVRGATLIGKGEDVLKKIDMIGNNLDMAQGMCGSQSGSVPTNVGQPCIRVSSMTVGGR
ncbi:MAG: TldD/PmbA family protein [Clostridia bacterium]